MIHLTLTTGHTRYSPRDEIGQDIIRLCRETFLIGFEDPPNQRFWSDFPQQFPGYSLSLERTYNALEATVLTHARGIVRIKIAPDERADAYLWPGISRRFQHIPKPESIPWCTVELLPEIVHYPDAVGWLGDFERCLAWAWVDFLKNTEPKGHQ